MLPGGDEERRGSTQVLCQLCAIVEEGNCWILGVRHYNWLDLAVHPVDQVWQEDQAYKGTQNKGRKRQSEGQRQLVAQGMGQTIRLLTLEASFMLLRHGPTTSKNTGAPSHEYTIDTSGFRVVCKCSRCIFISRLRRLYLQNLARFLVWALLSAIIFRRAAIHANHSNITD